MNLNKELVFCRGGGWGAVLGGQCDDRVADLFEVKVPVINKSLKTDVFFMPR